MALAAAEAIRGYRARPMGLNCVQPTLAAAAFDDDRARRLEVRAEPSLRAVYEAIGRPNHQWRRALEQLDAPMPPLLQGETRRQLDEAAGAAVRNEPSVRSLQRMERGWSDDTPSCGPNPAYPNLAFSAPAIRGDLAFVETSYECGVGTCGEGCLYALRRDENGRWTMLGVAVTWRS